MSLKPSPGRKVLQSWGSPYLLPDLSGTTEILSDLMSIVVSTVMSFILLDFGCFRWEGKSSPCYFTLASSGKLKYFSFSYLIQCFLVCVWVCVCTQVEFNPVFPSVCVCAQVAFNPVLPSVCVCGIIFLSSHVYIYLRIKNIHVEE